MNISLLQPQSIAFSFVSLGCDTFVLDLQLCAMFFSFGLTPKSFLHKQDKVIFPHFVSLLFEPRFWRLHAMQTTSHTARE